MFAPITSEITIKTGMVLKEIATDHLFEVSERMANTKEVLGDLWRIIEITPEYTDRAPLALSRQELAMRYFAEVEE